MRSDGTRFLAQRDLDAVELAVHRLGVGLAVTLCLKAFTQRHALPAAADYTTDAVITRLAGTHIFHD